MFLPDLAAVVKDCLAQVRDADQLLACLDGSDVDSGTCVEIGYAIALGKPILGYRTDFRASEIEGVNAMVRYGCTDYIKASSIKKSIEELAAILAARLTR
jgi:nucleoside 2-deoxyribosyltransferase